MDEVTVKRGWISNSKGNPNWRKGGPSPNPKGRPKTGHALAESIRKVTDPDQMAQIAWDIAQGKGAPFGQNEDGGWVAIVKPETRLAALNWLAQNGYIRPPTQIETTRKEPAKMIDFGRLSPSELKTFEHLIDRAASEEDNGGLPSLALPTEE